MRIGTMAFDSMSYKAKVKFDLHSHELVGFEQGTLKEDTLLKELVVLDNSPTDVSIRSELTNQLLIFIYTSRDADNTQIKSVVV